VNDVILFGSYITHIQLKVPNLGLQSKFKRMKTIVNNAKPTSRKVNKEKKPYLQGYPLYSDRDDIYNRYQKDDDVNPEDLSKKEQKKHTRAGKRNEKDFKDDLSGSDLDIPGSELDEKQEIDGSEDEENNYYSIGGDDHNNLEEYDGDE
jgi:hypothetical protein